MLCLDIEIARLLVQSIRDAHGPLAQQVLSDALAKRDQWLLENDLGALEMSSETRSVLENALNNAE